jgi:hypothetical protein
MVNPPAVDLADFANEHLAYEAQMFTTARNTLFALPSQQTSNAQLPQPAEIFNQNLLVESCVLHFRNLVDFFYPSSPQSDDISASDYAPSWGSPALPGNLKDARIRANKELAHLTLKRKAGSSPDKFWNFYELSITMGAVITDFLNRVDTSKIPNAANELRKIGAIVMLAPGPVFRSSQ